MKECPVSNWRAAVRPGTAPGEMPLRMLSDEVDREVVGRAEPVSGDAHRLLAQER